MQKSATSRQIFDIRLQLLMSSFIMRVASGVVHGDSYVRAQLGVLYAQADEVLVKADVHRAIGRVTNSRKNTSTAFNMNTSGLCEARKKGHFHASGFGDPVLVAALIHADVRVAMSQERTGKTDISTPATSTSPIRISRSPRRRRRMSPSPTPWWQRPRRGSPNPPCRPPPCRRNRPPHRASRWCRRRASRSGWPSRSQARP
ncbi:unnamed protein product [Prorocentrum cordatum]|uniref:Uncharacterized protein n=1 Tax=Prorocentrum cordatum TaxID=2364126 RepID=A0ABN9WWD4_9DINO|nr:unnamed protein product [Polarella glacialis]